MTTSAQSPPEPPTSADVVYGELDGNVVLVRRSDAEELAAVREAVRVSTTWGDLHARLSGARSAQLDEAFGDEDQQGEDVPLAETRVPGWDDADWPEAPIQTMPEWVPDAARRLGAEAPTRLSGEHLAIAPERTADVVAAMEAAGYAMDRDDALVERAAWG